MRDNPWDPVEINSASVFGTHVAEPILASGQTPRKQAGHMIASDPLKTLRRRLQARGRPHMGTCPCSLPGAGFAGVAETVSLGLLLPSESSEWI